MFRQRFIFPAILMVVFVLPSFITSTNKGSYPAMPEDTTFVTLLFAGDVMGHDGQINGARDSLGKYNYDTCFSFVKTIIGSADVAVANLEVTLAGGPFSGYPQFSSPDELALALKKAGFDVLATANNHTCDKGLKGVNRTIAVLDSFQIQHTGSYVDSVSCDSTNPLIINKKGFTIALYNYTYGTNGIAPPKPSIVNRIDSMRILSDLQKSLKQCVDLKIVFFHWGNEYQTYTSLYQQNFCNWAYNCGADMVIGSHPHVVQPATINNDSIQQQLTVYSMGNFISDQRTHPRDGGMMVSIKLARAAGRTRVAEAGYYLTWVYTPRVKGVKKHIILPLSRFETDTAFFSNAADYRKMLRYSNTARNVLRKAPNAIGEYLWNPETCEWKLSYQQAPEQDTSRVE